MKDQHDNVTFDLAVELAAAQARIDAVPKGGRPRKYGSQSERQAAYRARNAIVETRLPADLVVELQAIADEADISRAELVHQMIKFARANRDWRAQPMFGKPLPNAGRRVKASAAGGSGA